MVSVGGNLYSVPDATRKRVVEVQSHPKEVRIFENGRLVASHPVLEGRNQRRVDPAHRKAPPPSTACCGPNARGVGRRPLAPLTTPSGAASRPRGSRRVRDPGPHPLEPPRPQDAAGLGGARPHHAPDRARRALRARGPRPSAGRGARHPREPPHRRRARDRAPDAPQDDRELRTEGPREAATSRSSPRSTATASWRWPSSTSSSAPRSSTSSGLRAPARAISPPPSASPR